MEWKQEAEKDPLQPLMIEWRWSDGNESTLKVAKYISNSMPFTSTVKIDDFFMYWWNNFYVGKSPCVDYNKRVMKVWKGFTNDEDAVYLTGENVAKGWQASFVSEPKQKPKDAPVVQCPPDGDDVDKSANVDEPQEESATCPEGHGSRQFYRCGSHFIRA